MYKPLPTNPKQAIVGHCVGWQGKFTDYVPRP